MEAQRRAPRSWQHRTFAVCLVVGMVLCSLWSQRSLAAKAQKPRVEYWFGQSKLFTATGKPMGKLTRLTLMRWLAKDNKSVGEHLHRFGRQESHTSHPLRGSGGSWSIVDDKGLYIGTAQVSSKTGWRWHRWVSRVILPKTKLIVIEGGRRLNKGLFREKFVYKYDGTFVMRAEERFWKVPKRRYLIVRKALSSGRRSPDRAFGQPPAHVAQLVLPGKASAYLARQRSPSKAQVMVFPLKVIAFTSLKVGVFRVEVLVRGKSIGHTDRFGTFVAAIQGRPGERIKIRLQGRGARNHLVVTKQLKVNAQGNPVEVKVEGMLMP